jgi:short-subunit dehydrogenase
MSGPLAGKVALVTGASRGIGLAIGTALGAAGARVALAARGAEALETARAAVAASGAEARAYAGDVGDPAFSRALAARVASEMGPVDVLVNNAGVGVFRPLLETTPEELEAPLRVPVLAALTLAQACLPSMLARRSGAIVNLTSVGGMIPIPRAAAYSAARYGMTGLTLSLSEELRGTGVRAILLCAGEVRTEYFERNRSTTDDLPRSRRFFPVLSPEDVAAAAVKALRGRRDVVIIPRVMNVFVRLHLAHPHVGGFLMRALG